MDKLPRYYKIVHNKPPFEDRWFSPDYYGQNTAEYVVGKWTEKKGPLFVCYDLNHCLRTVNELSHLSRSHLFSKWALYEVEILTDSGYKEINDRLKDSKMKVVRAIKLLRVIYTVTLLASGDGPAGGSIIE